MVALVRSIARGFGKDGITAFSIAPGFTRTAMAQKSIDKYGEDFVIKDIALTNLLNRKILHQLLLSSVVENLTMEQVLILTLMLVVT